MNSANVLIKIFALLFLLLPSDARAQQSTPLQGSWTASVGPTEIFRGMWAAETAPQNRNAARGSWTLLNDFGDVILQGTFSVKKSVLRGLARGPPAQLKAPHSPGRGAQTCPPSPARPLRTCCSRPPQKKPPAPGRLAAAKATGG